MIKEALQYLNELFVAADGPEMVAVDGRTYCNRQLIPIQNPESDDVTVTTLNGLVSLLAQKIGWLAADDIMLVITNARTVNLQSISVDNWGVRKLFAQALAELPQPFPYGTYIDHNAFMIALRSSFRPTPDREYLITVASQVTDEVVTRAEDNGIAQKVALRTGVAVRESAELRPIVELAPYRTFLEVDQPKSEFIFRAKQIGPGQIPQLTLVEADGGAWRLKAIDNIEFRLVGSVQSLADPALSKVPIIA